MMPNGDKIRDTSEEWFEVLPAGGGQVFYVYRPSGVSQWMGPDALSRHWANQRQHIKTNSTTNTSIDYGTSSTTSNSGSSTTRTSQDSTNLQMDPIDWQKKYIIEHKLSKIRKPPQSRKL